MTDATPVLAAIATTALLLGGGIALAAPLGDAFDDETQQSPETDAQPPPAEDDGGEGEMTVEESEETHEGVAPTAPPFYASRVITLEGDLTLASLPVELDNVNGNIEVAAEAGDTYSLEANLTGYGATPDQARENRDEMRFEWDAGAPGDRRLVGDVELGGGSSDEADRKEAELTLTVPEDVELALVADSTNGGIDVADVWASSLVLDTTNAPISVSGTDATTAEIGTTNALLDVELADAREVLLDTTNGQIQAEVAPGESGSIEADTTNGRLDLLVPETDDRGYEATASTTNGQAAITLQDGESERSDDGSHATFLTDGFASRDVQTVVVASSTNGDVHVGPA